MSHFRFVPFALALAAASTLIACTTAPEMPMGAASASSMATPERMAAMEMTSNPEVGRVATEVRAKLERVRTALVDQGVGQHA